MINNDANNDNTHNELAKGTRVSHYRIVKKIGSGGMGLVYLAEDSKLNRQVALKFLNVEQTNDLSLRQQFMTEAQAAARLQHPNIITIHEVNEYNGEPFIAMAFIKGLSLTEMMLTKSFSITDIIDLGIQISSGLAVAHEHGITHRDLKPGNLMLDQLGTIKILDFGLATLSDTTTEHDPDKTVTSNRFANLNAGTISYMSPEQLTDQKISPLVDIFALGIILYEIITSKHPFDADSASEISARILRDSPVKVSDIRSDIPYDLNRIIQRCLQKNPVKRFQTARDICNELEELSAQLKNNITVNINTNGIQKSIPTLSEESFVLTTDLVRTLSTKDPKMIGSKLAYIDNKVSSDEVIFYLHGIGADHRQFSEVLKQLPYRAVAISVYGFDPSAMIRTPIELEDHTILIHAMLKDFCNRLKPKKVVLVGFSSGADHFLHILTSDLFDDLNVHGCLSLGCNIHLDDCFATSKFAELTPGDENQILSIIKLFSNNASTINDWVMLHNYLVTAFSKFKDQTEPLRQYATDILKPFLNESCDQFPIWYKNCMNKTPYVRFMIDTDSFKSLDRMMRLHLENNILGDDFHEDTIVRTSESHMEMIKTENVIRYTLDFMKLLS